MQCHDGMHLLYQGILIGHTAPWWGKHPCHQSIIGYVKPTARPPPYQWYEAANFLFNRYEYL
jgi:hypothetical protein